MSLRICSTVVALLIAATPSLAQTATDSATTNQITPGTTTPNGTTFPSTATTNGQSTPGSTETPATVTPSPIEPGRLDPSAPSQQRLLIDPGAAAGSTTTNPSENSSDPTAPGSSYNAILDGTSGSNGLSTGMSGIGVTPAPSPFSPSMYPQRLTTPPQQNPASTYPAPLTAPNLTQPGIGAGMGVGTPGSGLGVGSARTGSATGGPGVGVHSSLQSHALPRSLLGGGHAHSSGSHH